PAHPRGHHWDAARHGLERREAEAFLRRGQQEQIRDREERHDLVLLAERFDVAREAPLVHRPHRAIQLRTFTDKNQLRAHALPDALKYVDDGLHAFDGPEIRQVNDELVVSIRWTQTLAQIGQVALAMHVAFEKIRDHANIALQ